MAGLRSGPLTGPVERCRPAGHDEPDPFSQPDRRVPPTLANLDQWDGYAPQRTRLLQLLADAHVANPVVLAGDIHSTWLSELKLDFDRPESPASPSSS